MKRLLVTTLSSVSLLLTGCISLPEPIYRPVAPAQHPKPVHTEPKAVPEKPAEVHELKAVEDDNFDPDYMYPQTSSQNHTVSRHESADETPADTPMTKERCIEMIGQEKFDKYIQMLGTESAAIKRCILLQSMK